MRKPLIAGLAVLCVCTGLSHVRANESDTISFGDVDAALAAVKANASVIPTPQGQFQMPDDPWKRVKKPTNSGPESIGGYSAGCLRGAQGLELTGKGFQVMRLSRNRWWGHPELLDFIRGLAAATRSHNLGSLLIGDMGQPRGGPTLSGHASHQTGLDVDIWYKRTSPGTVLSPDEREKMSSPSLVKLPFDGLTKNWDPSVMDVLRDAASQPDVERIFVNPIIKKEVCAHHAGESWVGRLRPWWAHNDHFHVRLRCPSNSPNCKAQEPPASGDGCGADLGEWFTPEKRKESEEMGKHPTPPTMPKLPAMCAQVLTEP